MATLNTPKAFEKTLLDQETRKKTDLFIDYVNQNFDQIIRAFANQFSFADNFKGIFKTISASHNVPVSVDVGSTPQGVLILRQDVGIRSWVINSLSSGNVTLTFQFDSVRPVTTRQVTFSSPYATYEIEATSLVKVGEVIRVSGYGAKTNNGDFSVVKRSENLVTVYNDLAIAQTKATFTGTAESAVSVTLFILT